MVMLGHDGCEACAPEIARLQAECERLRSVVATLVRRASQATDALRGYTVVAQEAPPLRPRSDDVTTPEGVKDR